MNQLSPLERLGTSVALIVYFVVGYFSIQILSNPANIYEFGTSIDRRIPFCPQWVWMYLWALPAAAMPAFVVNSRILFRYTAVAYFVAITVSLLLFLAMPETAVALRPSTTRLDLGRPSEWLVANVYAIDPPGNLFPSLHLSMTALSAFAIGKANPALGLVAFFGMALVAVAACAVKQHFIIDVFGGLILAALVAGPTIGRYRRRSEPRFGGSVRGTVIFALFVCLFYSTIAGAFLIGFRVRRCPDVTGACLAAADVARASRPSSA